MKDRIIELERQVVELNRAINTLTNIANDDAADIDNATEARSHIRVKVDDLEDRVQHLEEQVDPPVVVDPGAYVGAHPAFRAYRQGTMTLAEYEDARKRDEALNEHSDFDSETYSANDI